MKKLSYTLKRVKEPFGSFSDLCKGCFFDNKGVCTLVDDKNILEEIERNLGSCAPYEGHDVYIYVKKNE